MNPDELRKIAELWWIMCAVAATGQESRSWVHCRATGLRAPTCDQLWEKVKERAQKLYVGKSWAVYTKAMVPQSDNFPAEPWLEYAWAFKKQ